MKITIIGAGKLGGGLASRLSKAGHEITVCFTRDEEKLRSRAVKLGDTIKVAAVSKAVKDCDVIILSMLWIDIDAALEQAGDMRGKVVIDATNPFGPPGVLHIPHSSVQLLQTRLPAAQLVRSLNMFTAEYQANVYESQHEPVAMFYATEHEHAGTMTALIIKDLGFVPVYLGGFIVAPLIEAPEGMLLNKSYAPDTAAFIAAAARDKDIDALASLIKDTLNN